MSVNEEIKVENPNLVLVVVVVDQFVPVEWMNGWMNRLMNEKMNGNSHTDTRSRVDIFHQDSQPKQQEQQSLHKLHNNNNSSSSIRVIPFFFCFTIIG